MPDWVDHPRAGYVLAAYAVAAVLLVGLAVGSWGEYRRRAREWKKLSQPDDEE